AGLPPTVSLLHEVLHARFMRFRLFDFSLGASGSLHDAKRPFLAFLGGNRVAVLLHQVELLEGLPRRCELRIAVFCQQVARDPGTVIEWRFGVGDSRQPLSNGHALARCRWFFTAGRRSGSLPWLGLFPFALASTAPFGLLGEHSRSRQREYADQGG